jgi:hypothetical protein
VNHNREVKKYCGDILKGKILSGAYTKKAVKRFTEDLERQEGAGFPYRFIPAKADEVIVFAENLVIPDITTSDKRLVRLPWMKFVYYNLYGWVHKDDEERRRFRSAYIEVARKNSKTTSLQFLVIIHDFLATESTEAYFVARGRETGFQGVQRVKAYHQGGQGHRAAGKRDRVGGNLQAFPDSVLQFRIRRDRFVQELLFGDQRVSRL